MIREIARSCNQSCHPDVTFQFYEVSLVIDNWGGFIVYNMLRQTLERGFRYHISVGKGLEVIMSS